MENEWIVNSILNGMEMYFRSFAVSKNIIHKCGDIEWIIPKPSHSGPAITFKVSLKKENVEQVFEELIPEINNGTVPSFWVIHPQSIPVNLQEIMLSKGFILLGDDEPGMALFTKDIGSFPEVSEGVEIKKVNSIQEFQMWVDTVNTALHGWDLLNTREHFNWVISDHMAFYLAFSEGKPVATSATIQNGSAGSVEFVSTLAEYRNKGIGTAISAAAIQGLQNTGVDIITLRACQGAINLYKRIGFKTYYYQTIMSYEGIKK